MTVNGDLENARLVLNPQAKSINTFISSQGDARIYLSRAIQESYLRSGCQKLSSAISVEAVFDVLGETACRLQNEKTGDLFDIELLEEIAWLICDRYPHLVENLRSQSQISKERSCGSHIISFPKYKVRKANSNI